MRPVLFALALFMLGACQSMPAANADVQPAREGADDAFLDGMAGDWVMEGQVMGDPVRYRAHGERVLTGAWMEMHMVDANATPPAYEARVFLGWDDEAHDYIAHWLDDFGASGARVAGRGVGDGDTLTILFPYADGVFRNIWARTDSGWTLTVDAQQPDGSWRNFGGFVARRR